jgi:hypothetical protein
MLFIAWETEKKLNTIKMTVMMLGISFENPWLNFKAIVKQISKKPASSKKIQAIDMEIVLVKISRITILIKMARID